MAELTLDVARKILDAALATGVEKKLKPLVITILDARGCVKVTAAQDGTSLMRAEIAHGKAYGALAMGMGSRALFQRAQEQAYFVSAVNTMAQISSLSDVSPLTPTAPSRPPSPWISTPPGTGTKRPCAIVFTALTK